MRFKNEGNYWMKPIYKTINFPNQNLVIADFMLFPNVIGLGLSVAVEEYQWNYQTQKTVTVIRFAVNFLCIFFSISIPCSFPEKENNK